jgi:signal transduction histidine kinase/CheY-like chemotaxis protein
VSAIHVLLVEDNPDHASLVRRALQRNEPPIDVTIATDGTAGLEAVALRPYSLVLLDYSLPRMSGLEVLRQIQARGLSVPVVMVTGQGGEHVAVEAMRAGAADYIVKTRDYFAALPAVVHKVVRQYELALDNSRLAQEVRRRLRETEGLLAVAQTLSTSLDVGEIARRTTRELAHLLGAETSLFVQPDEAGDCFRPVAGYQVPEALGDFRYRIMPEDLPAGACNGASPAHPATRGLPIQPHRFCYSPVLSNGRLFGALISYWWTEPRLFDGEDLRLAAGVASQMALALDNARLFADAHQACDIAQRQRDRALALSEVGRLIVSSLDLDRILDAIVEKARHLLGTHSAEVWSFDRETRGLRVVRGVGLSSDYLAIPYLEMGEGVNGRAVAEARPVWSRDVQEDPSLRYRPENLEQRRREGIHAALACPILTRGGIFGSLAVATSAVRDFTPDEVALLESLAQFAGIALENARLYEQIRSHAATLEQRVRERTAELEATNAQLAEASRAKSAFLANMSHELRTPLHAILGFTEVLLDGEFGDLTSSQREFLSEILDSGRHLVALIDDVLDLAKVEAGKVELRFESFDLAGAIASARDSLQMLAAHKRLQITVDMAAALPPLVADPARIKQVLYNLLSNAIKFTPEGGQVTISARKRIADCGMRIADWGKGQEAPVPMAPSTQHVAPSTEERIADSPEADGGRATGDGDAGIAEHSGLSRAPLALSQPAIRDPQSAMPGAEGAGREEEARGRGDAGRSEEWIEIRVADTGIGIAPEHQARIFQPFEQGQVPGLAKPEGTGLGLAVTRKLVELHGGSIRVDSPGLGRGSTFTVELPLRPLPAPPQPEESIP